MWRCDVATRYHARRWSVSCFTTGEQSERDFPRTMFAQGAEEETKKVPVTLLTGFLGAGKTTFLKYVLTEHHGKRIAVIQNEFGAETGADTAALIFGEDGDPSLAYVELPNGCVCCSVRGDLVLALENLMTQKNKFDYIFIETTGLADPGPLAATFWVDEELESDLYLDGIVTVVDALNFERHLDEKKPAGVINEAQRQVAFADIVILNKRDLVTEEKLNHLESRVRAHNAVARIIKAEQSRVDLEQLLGIRAFDAQRVLEIDPLLVTDCTDDSHDHDADHSCHHAHQHLRHDQSVETFLVKAQGSLDLDEFNAWLGGMLWDEERSEDIFRMKGILAVEGHEAKHALQAVHNQFEVQETKAQWGSDEPRECRLVFIGRNMNEEELTAGFSALVKQ